MVVCFLESAKLSSITKAAAKLYFTQQTVSRHITALEKELGVTLLKRSGSGVTLTQGGTYYYALLENSVYNSGLTKQRIADYYKGMNATLHLGFSEWVNPYGELYSAIMAFMSSHPELKLSVRVYDNNTLSQQIRQEQVDVAFFSEGHLPHNVEFHAVPICQEEISLVGPEEVVGLNLPLSQRKKRSEMTFLITPGWDRGYMESMVLSHQEVGKLSPKITKVQLVPNYSSQCTMMQQGNYLAFCDKRFGFIHDMVGMNSEPLGIESSLYCCSPFQNENKNAQQLILFLKKALNPDQKK
jgi:DNA-binding transcriptional LysR family regulator